MVVVVVVVGGWNGTKWIRLGREWDGLLLFFEFEKTTHPPANDISIP